MKVLESSALTWMHQAAQRLSWAWLALAEMDSAGQSGDLDGCERGFSRILSDVSICHTALCKAAKLTDYESMARHLGKQRRMDPLLFYFWHARNVDVHHVLQRSISSHQLVLAEADPAKARRVSNKTDPTERAAEIIFAAMGVGSGDQLLARSDFRQPNSERLAALGLRVDSYRASLSLLPFAYRNDRGELINVPGPEEHLGKPFPNVASAASKSVIEYYASAYGTVKQAAVARGIPL